MAVKGWNWHLAGVLALATAAPVMLVAPAGASSTTTLTGSATPLAQIAAAQGKIAAGHVALFTAATSAGATAITWTLSGPGVLGRHFSATCGASTLEMESSFGRAGVIHVTVQVKFTSGTVRTATHRLVVTAAKVHPIARKMAKQATQWLLCLRGPPNRAVQAVSNGGPPRGCQDQYFDGPIDAIGCFSVLPSYNKIPAPERSLICRVIRCPKSKTAVVPELLPVLSRHTVRLNGIDIAPARAFVLDQNDGLLVSSNATASMLKGLLRLHSGQLRLAEYSAPLFSVNLNQLLARYPALATALDLSGFKISGRLTVSLAHHASIIKASITLPGSFTGSTGKPVTSSAKLIATNSDGLVVDQLLIRVPSADFGGSLSFDKLAFCYQHHISERFCEKKTGANFGSFEGTSASSWNATAKVNILGTIISAVPTPSDPQQGIGFVNGQFNFGGATVTFNPSIPLGDTGVDLSSLGASLALNPTRFHGSIGLTAGDLVSINGQLFMVFASPSQPYTFSGHEIGASAMPTPTVRTVAIAVGGNVGIDLPVVGNTALASGYVLFYPGYLATGGNINVNIGNGALVISGGVNGQFSLHNTTFDVEGTLNVSANALGISIGMSADAVVSSIGIAACGSVSTPFGNVSAGAAYTWNGSVNAWFGSCDLSPYRVIVTIGAGHTNSASSPIRLHVPAHLPTEMIQVRGHGGAPEVTVAGPGGTHLSIGDGSKAFSKPFMIFRNARTDTTYIVVLKPAAGTYQVTANPGSPRITEVLAAQGRTGSVVQRFKVHVHN